MRPSVKPQITRGAFSQPARFFAFNPMSRSIEFFHVTRDAAEIFVFIKGRVTGLKENFQQDGRDNATLFASDKTSGVL